MSPLLFSLEGARHFDHDEPVPSHFVATVIRGSISREVQLESDIAHFEAEIAHLHEIIEQFCIDAQFRAEGHLEQRGPLRIRYPRKFFELNPIYTEQS